VVDDDATVREVASRMLEHVGFPAISALNGQEVVATFETHRDAVTWCLLDLPPPRIDGVAPLDLLRSAALGTPVVLASGGGLLDAEIQLASGKVPGVIQTPSRIERILQPVLG
jgi:CheY-like chemotaxis protein